MKKFIIYGLLAVMLCASCTGYVTPQLEELGFAGKGFGDKYTEITIGSESGTFTAPFYSDDVVRLCVVEGERWLSIDPEKTIYEKDGSAVLSYDSNTGYPRLALVELSATNLSRRDTLRVRQRGYIEPRCAFYDAEYLLGNEKEKWIELDSNVPDRYVTVDVSYKGQSEGWLKRSYVTGKYLVLKFSDNDTEESRSAFVTLRADNGWGEKMTAAATILQDINN